MPTKPTLRCASCQLRARSIMDSSPEPEDAAGYYERGRERFDRKEHDAARCDFEKALELNPSNAPALTGLAAVLTVTGYPEDALAHLNEALQLDPHYAKAYSNRGCIVDAKGRKSEAIKDFTASIHCDPTFALAYLNRGLALTEIGPSD